MILFALLLHFPWELIQAPLYEGMASAAHWDAVKRCARATLGDATIAVFAYAAVAAAARNRWWILRSKPRELVGFVALGLLVTAVIEILATRSPTPSWGWKYAEAMPLLPGLEVGLAPIAQWTILPLLLIWFVGRQLKGAAKGSGTG